MATDDITRSIPSRDRRYAAVRMQQGRVLTDSDVNAEADLVLEDARLTRLGVVGPFGSSDDGFRITNPAIVAGRIDFTIGSGTLHLGGHRIERLHAETFRLQSDWLNNPGIAAPNGTRLDLAYVVAWLQPVSAVEDGELIEAALGGPDTTTRLRLMARVNVATSIGASTCEEAWAVVRDRLASAGLGTVDAEMRLVPDTRFTVGLAAGSGGDDLCAPEVVGGYLGAENQAIRVTLLGGDRFIWGYDNGAPLYRVLIENGGTTVRFLTEPKDVLQWPATGQTVEVISWGAVLSNGEKLADEALPGHFALVEGGYNPDTATLTLTPATAVPAAFGTTWQGRADAAALQLTRYGLEGPAAPYYFLRVWNRGPDVSALPTLPLLPAPAALGATGLTLTVTGANQRPGDHCIIAARPATPDRVQPWELLVGRPPHGTEFFVAPLALLRWQNGVGEVLHDCRPRFRPLTQMRDCCTYNVGDGEQSFGDFDSIQAAIDALPPTGGQICILPGRHAERVVVEGRANVTITGCGLRSLIEPPDNGIGAAITIRGGSNIRLVKLAVAATFGPAIVATGAVEDGRAVPLRGLLLESLELAARDSSAIDVRLVERLKLVGSQIAILQLAENLALNKPAGRSPAVFIQGDDVLVADNRIETFGATALQRALGGLQIGGGSSDVLIRDNLIRGGNGNGITLGHVFLAEAAVARLFEEDFGGAAAKAETYFAGFSIAIDENGCVQIVPPGADADPDDPDPPRIPVSGGDLAKIEIRDNVITDVALTGIATPLAFRGLRPIIVAIAGLKIDGNRITGTATLELPELPRAVRLYVAFGGIALAAVEIGAITGNHIEANGRSHVEPVCGIYLLSAETVVIADNRVIDNGPRIATDQQPKPGTRGGIVILSAAPNPTAHASSPDIKVIRDLAGSYGAARAVGLPAVLVHDNVVQQPMGKALVLFGHGHMSISANHFASQGTPTRSFVEALTEILADGEGAGGLALLYLLIDRLLGSAVTVVNIGFSSELADAMLLVRVIQETKLGASKTKDYGIRAMRPAAPGAALAAKGWAGAGRLLRNGEVQFNDNAVVQSFLDAARSFTLSAGLLVSFDDLAVADNSFSSQVDFIGDFSVADLIAYGWSLRCTGNRFEETLLHSMFSAVTIGLYNTTAHNQGTHCFSIAGHPALTTDGPNHSLIQLASPLACGGCLKPPFAGLSMVARSAGGAVITPEMRTIAGHSGLWFDDSLEIELGVAVESISLSTASEGDRSIVVVATGAGGEKVTARINHKQPGEAFATLRGTALTTVEISGGDGRAVLTRLCVDRPSALPGMGAASPNVIAVKG